MLEINKQVIIHDNYDFKIEFLTKSSELIITKDDSGKIFSYEYLYCMFATGSDYFEKPLLDYMIWVISNYEISSVMLVISKDGENNKYFELAKKI